MTGCIPTGYEMILRAAGAQGIDFNSFQDDFDLDKDLPPDAPHGNHFGSVADAVKATYPSVVFAHRSFAKGEGGKKLAFIEQQVTAGRLVLISLALVPFGLGGWHIMPVVDAEDDKLVLLWSVTVGGQATLMTLPKAELLRIHDNFPGGDEVAFLERC
jgi:hypothetical protein